MLLCIMCDCSGLMVKDTLIKLYPTNRFIFESTTVDFTSSMINEPSYYVYDDSNITNLSRVKALHASGADVLANDEYGKTLVYYAAKNRNLTSLT
jgi:hypothetical protein